MSPTAVVVVESVSRMGIVLTYPSLTSSPEGDVQVTTGDQGVRHIATDIYDRPLLETSSENEGASIINLSLIDGISLYCCGTPIYNGSAIVCPDGDSFQVDDGEVILGRAALANATTISSNGTSSNSTTATSSASSSNSHNVAIGAGVGVPLGVIAIGTLIWALWERKRANRLSKSLATASVGRGTYNEVDGLTSSSAMTRSSAPRELDPQLPVAELMSKEQPSH
ncbi:hypothetical protein N7478_005521 [Penicillium angulare]|uniref:uncharacterized protein n=1 Tax=Penicillium angulare TaxID=116970 RepID=UPI00253F716B|nr:uncharacterized protein N7478_005521 [Penicillium angulare]KAJ5280149.1 hypothetical protein N7478_005521 [Penicillium angulare]